MKIESIVGEDIRLREVCIEDAEFILSLRLDKVLGKFISPTDANLDKQIEWIKQCKKRANEFYFIIEGNGGIPYGAVRIYDITKKSYTFGSWIVKREAPAFMAIKAFFLINEVCFCKLGFPKAYFDTKKVNIKLLNFFRRLGSTQINEGEDRVYFSLTYAQYKKVRQRYRRFVPEKLRILEEP